MAAFLQLNRPVNLYHYSCFENQGRFVTLKKKLGTLLFENSRVQKNKVIIIQKKKRQPGLFFFWFLHPAFCKKQGLQFFKSSRP